MDRYESFGEWWHSYDDDVDCYSKYEVAEEAWRVRNNEVAELKEDNKILKFDNVYLQNLLEHTRSRLKHNGMSTGEVDFALGIKSRNEVSRSDIKEK